MKKFLSVLMCVLLLSGSTSVFSFAVSQGKTYYVDSENGAPGNSGLSETEPFKKASDLLGITLNPGDRVLFRKGCVFICNALTLTCSGTEEKPITISSYGEGARPLLTANGYSEVLRLYDCSYLSLSGLEITARNGGGIWIDTLNKESRGITVSDVIFHDVQNTEAVSRDNLSSGAAAARACIMVKGLPARSRFAVNDLTVTDCEMYDCGNGISVWGSWNDEQKPHCEEKDIDAVFNTGLLIKDCYFHNMDAEAMVIGMCDGALITNCRVIDCTQNDGITDTGNKFCNAAAWFWGSVNSTFSHCEIAGQKCVGDGMTCDFDSYTHYCTYEYIYSHDNMRFVNNCPINSGHHGNCIRYCLSVNDNKERSSLSQSHGEACEYGIQFYNNTLVNLGEFSIEGVRNGYIANNIFYGNFTNDFRWSRKNVDDDTGRKYMNEFTGSMVNNCFWGSCIPLCAEKSRFCNPRFAGSDFSDPASFMLTAGSKLIGSGYNVKAEGSDIFGNPIGESKNIGCYAGSGVSEKAPLSFLRNTGKFFSTVLGMLYQFIVDCNNKYWLF